MLNLVARGLCVLVSRGHFLVAHGVEHGTDKTLAVAAGGSCQLQEISQMESAVGAQELAILFVAIHHIRVKAAEKFGFGFADDAD